MGAVKAIKRVGNSVFFVYKLIVNSALCGFCIVAYQLLMSGQL